MTSSLDELLAYSQKFLEDLREHREPTLIVSHYDADGLSSASIFAWIFLQLDIPFHLVFVEQTYPDTLEDLPFKEYSYVVFLDLGSGYKELIKKFTSNKKVMIVDHHVPSGPERWDHLVEINPYIVGVDASTHTSSSTLSYSIALRVVRADENLIPVALAGALGDRLDVGEKSSLLGLNRAVLEEGKRRGVVGEAISLRLFGFRRRPLVEALASTIDPYIPGLSGNPTACIKFLESIGINPRNGDAARDTGSLSHAEIKHLASELIKYMISMGVNVKEAEKIFGYNYFSLREADSSPLKDLREYAYVLNALGRLDQYGTAISLNLGHRGKYIVRAEESIKEYRRLIAKQLSNIMEQKSARALSGRATIVYFIEENMPKLTGPVSSILANEFAQVLRSTGNKIVGVASPLEGEKVKVSFRRLDESVNLGSLLQKYAKELNFVGGGHPAAGGALLDEKILEELLKRI